MAVSSAAYGRQRYISSRTVESVAKQLTGRVYEVLSEQAALHAADPNSYRDNHVSVAQLRDDILRDEYSTWRRKKVWDAVQKKVERNSNVRPMVREGRSGDVGRVWEWVGAVGRLESSPQSGGHERRKSGRVSFGGDTFIEPRREEEVGEVTRWKEQGGYY
ncbi:inner nuclear membrane protein enriched at telomere/subtelomere region [Saxophila tyrrhenica]|uniref:Inner nuclear membrane protein enriched at telomere/subtelomere region n=1 Tax=Saxophila tyrrhenica TaxID=1690608 RepID=A0AAV9PBY2_9PEZI|nr:inner nuclear membrane protein enriched at telomere/subtelomere region [Saxophila tyrrhenica]